MSDLAATNCGCGCDSRNNGCNSMIWIIIILLFCCNGHDNGILGGCDNDNGCNSIWIIIILLFCCNGSGFGGCGC